MNGMGETSLLGKKIRYVQYNAAHVELIVAHICLQRRTHLRTLLNDEAVRTCKRPNISVFTFPEKSAEIKRSKKNNNAAPTSTRIPGMNQKKKTYFHNSSRDFYALYSHVLLGIKNAATCNENNASRSRIAKESLFVLRSYRSRKGQ